MKTDIAIAGKCHACHGLCSLIPKESREDRMSTALIHFSDFHNVVGKHENHSVVVDELFLDLRRQLTQVNADHVFVAFSGDIAQSGQSSEQYIDFKNVFHRKLCEIGIPKANRICVPGNHDLSQDFVQAEYVVHEGVVGQNLSEERFNDFVLKRPNVLTDKFKSYLDFEVDFAQYGLGPNSITGAGWTLVDDIGVYCINTALCSSGGLFKDGGVVPDKGRLCVDTRSLHTWVQTCKAKWKVMVMHHPLSWLAESSQKEIKALLNKHFVLRLYGHEHEQEKLHSINAGNILVECCAPALFSKKSDQLGYSIFLFDREIGLVDLTYRQWTKHQTFVSGVDFSNNDSGKIVFNSNIQTQAPTSTPQHTDLVLKHYSSRLENALVSFSGQPRVWVDPIVKTKPEHEKDEASIAPLNLDELVAGPISSFIHAFPQFGLTCLAHFLVREAWRKHACLWLYLDAKELKPGTVKGAVALELLEIERTYAEVKCVVIDSVSAATKDAWKIVTRIIEHFPGIPIICMNTLDPASLKSEKLIVPELSIKFQLLYLWTLTRSLIRGMVSEYNDTNELGEESAVITRIVDDLEMLNLHRTPLNCLTLLKVSEVDFDESPVNRSEMIKRVLFLLFNADSIPTYKARPDLKDCEFVLGYFCEKLLMGNIYVFSRAYFLKVLQTCCNERLIDLEVQVVFDVLSANNILIPRGGEFSFKFSFWLYYFAALRMHHDSKFASYMLSNLRYANLPELIEFYTGIDRQRGDALIVLQRDLSLIRSQVEEKCGLPKDFQPYQLAQWTPSEIALEKMKKEIEEGVRDSNLPVEIKDRFADRDYDSTRPYDQSVNILAEQTVTCLMQTLRAASKALRNSDYAAPEIKKSLLEEILRCWEQLTMVLIVIIPILADKGLANFDGANFVLDGDFGFTMKERVSKILMEIPANVVKWSRDDLHSQKMGPLFLEVFSKETEALRKHELALLLIVQRPRGWREAVQQYISNIQKNSFYLLDVYRSLRTQYRFSYVSNPTLKDIEYLIQMAATKHVTGTKEPGTKLIQKTLPTLIGERIVPEREV
jgi:hypothetical protein